MPDPAAIALAIPELLEAILLQLSPRDLLLAQRVDKSFFNAIQASKYIRRKLFFIAPPTADGEHTLLNPFLGRVAQVCSGNPHPWFRVEYCVNRFPVEDHLDQVIGDIRALPCGIQADETLIIITTSMPVKGNVLQQSSFRKMLIANETRLFVIGSICDSHMHYNHITTNSMAEVMEMLDKKWVEEMCPNDPNAS